MKFSTKSLEELAKMICGNHQKDFFIYRSSSKLTDFFDDCDTQFKHDSSSRVKWVIETLKEILDDFIKTPFEPLSKIVEVLMDKRDAYNEEKDRSNALEVLNDTLSVEGYRAYYGKDNKCRLELITSNKTTIDCPDPHRQFSSQELARKEKLLKYLNKCSEDQFIEEILLPLFRELGFRKVTAVGHKDKALEHGMDGWMKFKLPTQNDLYFGFQVKIGKIDASGKTKSNNYNVAEIFNQTLMMLGKEVFDHEINKKVLVDHAYIIAREITKSAKLWLAERLDASQRSQIMFMDRDDILNLFVVTKIPIPSISSISENQLPI